MGSIKQLIFLGGVALTGILMCPMAQPVLAAEPAGLNTWVRTARIGGAAVWVDMTDAEMNPLLNKLAAQHVSVIEADSDLSNYLTDAEFDQELALMKNFA